MINSDSWNELACIVCGKPKGIPLEECHDTFGRNNPSCNDAKGCRILEKTEEQLEYVHSSSCENIFLKACPGSGKTESVGLKAAYEIKRWNKKVGGIAVLTFTNSASDVIAERVTQFAGIEKLRYPHFIGTIDSWLHGYIAHPFGHVATKYSGKNGDCTIRVVESGSTSDFLHSFKTKYCLAGTGNVLANQYYEDIESNSIYFSSSNHRLDFARNSVSLHQWQFDDLKKTKEKFWAEGFATYQDIENICYKLLGESSELAQLIAERFPLIIVDECQDLSWIQLQIFKKLLDAGVNIHFIGDLNQGIYAFKKVYPQEVEEFIDQNDFGELALSRNFRSIEPIVDLCGRLIDQGDIKGELPSEDHDPACVCFTYNKDEIQKIVDRFVSYLEQRKIAPEKCAIVARGYATVNKLRPGSSRIPEKKALWLPTAIHLWQNGSAESMDEALKCVGRFVADRCFSLESTNSRAYYCPESVSSHIQWRVFLAQILDKCLESPTLCNLNLTWKNWAREVRRQFQNIVKSCSGAELLSQSNSNFSFSALKGKSAEEVISTLATVKKSNVSDILVTTFHKVKGRTFDAILVVSAPDKRGDGGHWSQWIDGANDEHARFAYVASSRPKFLLGWAVPSPSDGEKKQLEKLGFTMIHVDGEIV